MATVGMDAEMYLTAGADQHDERREYPRGYAMKPLLLITATRMEAAPLHAALRWQPEVFALGELYRCSSLSDVYLAHLGIAKVNTAAGLAVAISQLHPRAVLQFGIGGAYTGSFLSIGMIAAACEEWHIDTGVHTPQGWQDMRQLGFSLWGDYYNCFPTDAELTAQICAKSGAPSLRFATAEAVTGDFALSFALQERLDVAVESMEGAAAAQVCTALAVPFAELRAVSNIVGERDKSAWNIPLAVRRVNEAMLAWLEP